MSKSSKYIEINEENYEKESRDVGDMRCIVCRLTTALLQTQDVLGNMWIGKWSMNRNWNWQLEQRLEQELGDGLEQ